MQFITTDQRIAVENFEIGLIYTVTFTSGSYFLGACIGKGADFVMFQRTAPELVYCLNMAAAEDVESIEQTGGGGGTLNYNDLYNKPQINNVELAGNKSLDNLGIQAKLTFDSAPIEDSENPVQSGGVYSALAQKQDALSSEQLNAVNSGITIADVTQIETNKNNILKATDALVELVDGGAKNTVDIPTTSISGNGFIIPTDTPWICKAGTYVLSYDSSASSGGGGTLVVSDDNGEIARYTITTVAGQRNVITFEVPSNATKIRWYATLASTYSNIMICTKAAWNISNEYQPYRPSYQEIYERVVALEQANQ